MNKTAIMAVCLLAAACAGWFMLQKAFSGAQAPDYESQPVGTPIDPDPSAASPVRAARDRNLPMPGQDRLKLASDSNAFALNMYARLRSQEGNLFFSPYSVSSALAMTYAGARTKTAEEMRKTLHLSLPDEKLFAAYAEGMREANDPDKPFELAIANSLWGQSGLAYKKDFLALAEKTFGAALQGVDFKGDPAGACSKINAWVNEKTRGKIPVILDPRMVSDLLRLVLVNAVYFKGDWERKFEKEFTSDQPFFAARESTLKVPLMRQTGTFGYANDGRAQYLSMPYKGKELSMAVILPRDKSGIKDLEDRLAKGELNGWLSMLRPSKVEVWLPKFKLETTCELGKDLAAMGMFLAFAPYKGEGKPHADLSGLLDPKVDRLHIGFVIHKAFVEVNEEGTEAAAATAVGMARTTSVSRPLEVQVFRADHPFIFLIREDRTGAILFMGRFSQP